MKLWLDDYTSARSCEKTDAAAWCTDSGWYDILIRDLLKGQTYGGFKFPIGVKLVRFK